MIALCYVLVFNDMALFIFICFTLFFFPFCQNMLSTSINCPYHYVPISGLKDLADFLPASLGTIVGYFSAEVTRGLWKPAFMNGSDWPSPTAYLSIVEQQIKKILATTGVDIPYVASGVHLSYLRI